MLSYRPGLSQSLSFGARDSRRERHYKPKPNLEKDIRFGLFSCSSQIHFYRNDYNLRSFILNFAYNFTLADI